MRHHQHPPPSEDSPATSPRRSWAARCGARALRIACVCGLALALAACAGGAADEGEPGETSANGATNNASTSDGGTTGANAGTTSTNGGTTSANGGTTSTNGGTTSTNGGTTAADVGVDADEADAEEDAPEDTSVEEEPDVVDPCSVCCAGQRRCQAGAAVVEICVEDGTGYAPSPCDEGEQCEGGVCVPPPQICTPGRSSCLDLATRQTCNAQGTELSNQPCPDDGLCIEGVCSVGAPTGAACEADDACAGGQCLCRGDETCPPDLGAVWSDGYCTLDGCLETGCLGDEWCVDLSIASVLDGANFCVEGCLGCDAPGYACRQLPSRDAGGRVVWDEGCFPTDGPRDMAQFCETDSQCLGGRCWNGGRYPSNGYCTMACGDSGDCPSGSSCVHFEVEGGHFCAPDCAPGCPAGLGVDVSCQRYLVFGGDPLDARDLRNVCAPTLID